MASGIFYPAAGADDGYWFPPNAAFYAIYDGQFGSSTSRHNAWVCFDSVTIPQGSVITSAYVTFQALSNQSGTNCNVECFFEDVDDAAPPTNTTEANALSLTSPVEWNNVPAWTINTDYDTPELKTILQPVIDRPGFFSGHKVQIVVKTNLSSDLSTVRSFKTLDQWGSDYAELHVEWTPPTFEIRATIPQFEPELLGSGYLNFLIPPFEAGLWVPPFITADIPSFTAILAGHDNVTHMDSEDGFITMPSFTASLTATPQASIAADIPAFTAAGFLTHPGQVRATLPAFAALVEASQAGTIEIELPALTAELLGSARAEATVPSLEVDLSGVVGIVINGDATLPSLTAAGTGTVEIIGDIEATLPTIRTAMQGTAGKIASLAATLPSLEASLIAHPGSDGDINVTIPGIIALGNVWESGRFDSCGILAYPDVFDCAGEIEAAIPSFTASLTES